MSRSTSFEVRTGYPPDQAGNNSNMQRICIFVSAANAAGAVYIAAV
jgi:hypothetical protein